ncbi:DUF11 domain-containing protein [Rhodococcus hoagii]|nr:DUF11 domain-containing protein [Prescottella equi]
MSRRTRRRTGAYRRATLSAGLTSSLLLSLTAFTAGVTAPTAAAAPQPTFSCDAYGYLFQAPNGVAGAKTVTKVDLATGDTMLAGSTSRALNAVGYNQLDNYIYGWDWDKMVPVRIGSDLSETELPLPAGMPAAKLNTGDFDSAGNFWVTANTDGSKWYKIDYAPGSPTYGKLLASGIRSGQGIADWAWIDGGLYGVDVNQHLLRFDGVTHKTQDLGAVSGLEAGMAFGAVYVDAKGYLYGSDNTSGKVYRIDTKTRVGTFLANGPASSGNDGARCASAGIPTVTVSKTIDGRVHATDQFTVGLVNDRAATVTSATTSGTDTTASTIDWPVSQGKTYAITDTPAAGSSSVTADYTPAIACTDTTTGQTVPVSGTGPWTLQVTDIHDYQCSVTNTGLIGGLTIVKASTTTEITEVGQKVPYTFAVTNTGNVTVQDIKVADTQVAPAKDENLSEVSCPDTELAPGESTTCTAEYTVAQADFDHGSIKDTAKATGSTPTGNPVESPETTDSGVEIGVTGGAGGLEVVKASTTTAITEVGQKVPYTFAVTNTGNVTVTDIVVTDTQVAPAQDENLSPVTCPEDTLAPGKSTTCTAEYTVSQADFDHGSIADTAKAAGSDPKGGAVESPATPGSGVEIGVSGGQGGLEVVKASTTTAITQVGQKVPYTFAVTNTGNVTVKDITVTDTQVAPADDANMSEVSCPDTELAPGESTVCTAEYTVSQADFDHGSIADTAKATGSDPKGGDVESPATPGSGVEIGTSGAAGGLSVVKSSTTTAITGAGQKVPYTFAVTNTGNVTVKDITVTDTQVAPADDANMSEVSCPATTLAPGAAMDCTAEYTVSQADFDHGSIADTAKATGSDPKGGDVESPATPGSGVEIGTTGAHSELAIVKSSTTAAISEVGQKVPYTFAVTNTGNLTVSDIVVTDTQVAPAQDANLSPVTCPATTLAPGKSMDCTAEYTVSQADFDHGSIADTAKATGTGPNGDPVTTPESSDSGKEITTAGARPELTVVKTSTTTEITTAGQKIPYLFAVTNTGNVTATDVTVVDKQEAPALDENLTAVSCPATTLAPGASMDCTAEYTVSNEDVKFGAVTDIAAATGRTVTGDPIESLPSEKSITKQGFTGSLPGAGSLALGSLGLGALGLGSLGLGSLDLGSLDLPAGSADSTHGSTHGSTPGSSDGSTGTNTEQPSQPGNGNGHSGNGNGGNGSGNGDNAGQNAGHGNGQSGNQAGSNQSGNATAQGARIDSGAGAGESGVDTGLLAAGGVVLVAALAVGGTILARRRN